MLVLHELFKLLNILVPVESYTLPLSSVSSCPAGLLVIALEAFRNIIMNDIPDIGFVYAHAKSNGCNNHINLFHEKTVLVSRPCGRIHTGVIGKRFYTVNNQGLCKFFNLFTAKTVNNSRFT